MSPDNKSVNSEKEGQDYLSWREKILAIEPQMPSYEESLRHIDLIQPIGCVLVLQLPELTIIQASENTSEYLGSTADQLKGKSLKSLFTSQNIKDIQGAIATGNIPLNLLNPYALTLKKSPQTSPLPHRKLFGEFTIHEDKLFFGLEPFTPLSGKKLQELNSQLTEGILRIRQTQTSTELYQVLCDFFAKITGYDRIMLYEFEEDNTGIVRAEVVSDGHESYLGLHYPASDVPIQARSLFVERGISLIGDTQAVPVKIQEDEKFALGTITLRAASPCHCQYLINMGGVRGAMAIALTDENRLWGLIAGHHYSPRWLSPHVRKVCELIRNVASLEIVIKQKQLFEQYQHQIHTIETSIRQSLLKSPEHFLEQLCHSRNELLKLISADGCVIQFDNKLEFIGTVPSETETLQLLDKIRIDHNNELYVSDVLGRDYPDVQNFQTPFGGVMVITIGIEEIFCQLAWFRLSQTYTVDWSGHPQNSITSSNAEESIELTPRKSFLLWQESVQGRSIPWETVEIKAVNELRHSLILAVLKKSQTVMQESLQKAEIASVAKSEFLANMSHEIRTPMNAILGFTQLLETTNLNKEQQGYLESINYGGEQLLEVINDVLDLSKLEAGELKLEKEEFSLSNTLKKIQQLLASSSEQKGLAFRLDSETNLPVVYGARNRLDQILINLVRNAIKFTETGSIIVSLKLLTSTTDSSKTMAHFSVTDTGIGIAKEDQLSIFESFSQVDGAMSRRYEGTGLGLTICRKLTHLMGGEIGLESELDIGSRFWFTIPLKIVSISNTNGTKKAPVKLDVFSKSSWKILMVEDNPFNQKLTQMMLRKFGLGCDIIADGDTAIGQIAEFSRYDIVLMDCQLPGASGYDITAQLRDWEKGRDIHTIVIGMTANAMEGDREKCLQAGMDDYLAKPFKIDQFHGKLQQWFEVI